MALSAYNLRPTARHSHECRDCGLDIDCNARLDDGLYCPKWNGSNDGCMCAPHGEDCRNGYRCWACYQRN